MPHLRNQPRRWSVRSHGSKSRHLPAARSSTWKHSDRSPRFDPRPHAQALVAISGRDNLPVPLPDPNDKRHMLRRVDGLDHPQASKSAARQHGERQVLTLPLPCMYRSLLFPSRSRFALAERQATCVPGRCLRSAGLPVICRRKDILHKFFKRSRCSVLPRTRLLRSEDTCVDRLEHLDVHRGFLRRHAHLL
jgi:hypothetical protein